MYLSPSDAQQIAAKILARSRADSCTVSINGRDMTNVRFAVNNATTNGSASELSVEIESNFGQRSGAASVTSLDDGALERAQARSEEIARLAPANPEFMPPLGPQAYEQGGAAFDVATAAARAADIAAGAKAIIAQTAGRPVNVTGYGETYGKFSAFATSAGLFVHDRRTSAEFTLTARSTAQNWSGWSCSSQTRLADIDAARIGERAIGKASYDTPPIDVEPGKYTVILEPAAVADLVAFMLWHIDARSADEGRSFLAKKGGGAKLGERLFDERVTISSDPLDSVAPDTLFANGGLPRRRTVWVENGVMKNLSYSRFWAQKMGREPLPRPSSFAMAGGSTPVEEMIRDTKRGILVTRLWYIRDVDPQTLLLTGMTRDGNFLIENGRIVGPARNLRFNESPVSVLNNILALGAPERTAGSEDAGGVAAPPLLVKDFTFSSKSSGI